MEDKIADMKFILLLCDSLLKLFVTANNSSNLFFFQNANSCCVLFT